MRKLLASSFLAVSLLAIGCGGGGDCNKAVDHVFDITMKEMGALIPADKKGEIEKEMKGQKEKAVKECQEKKYSKKQFDCIMAAKTMNDLGKCDGLK